MSLLAPAPHRTDRRRPERGVTGLGEADYRPPMASPPGEQTMTELTATPDTAPRPPVTAGDVAELLEPLRREILAHCYRMTGSVQAAEDLVQETCLGAWGAFTGFETGPSLGTWVFRIATNACRPHLEARRRRPLPTGLGQPAADPRDSRCP